MKMPRKTRNFMVVAALLTTLVVSGCKKKKQQQQVAQAPTLSSQQPGSPAQSQAKTETAGNTNSQITTTHPAAQAQAQNHPNQPRPKPKPKSTPAKDSKTTATPKKDEPETAVHSSPPVTVAQNTPPRITIEQSYPETGGTISATAPHSDDAHNKLSTQQLLQSTEDNLRSVKRTLTPDEQSQVVQIRNFMLQSRSATADSDSVRARNLALKAHLLSDELVRHR